MLMCFAKRTLVINQFILDENTFLMNYIMMCQIPSGINTLSIRAIMQCTI